VHQRDRNRKGGGRGQEAVFILTAEGRGGAGPYSPFTDTGSSRGRGEEGPAGGGKSRERAEKQREKSSLFKDSERKSRFT